MDVFGLCCDGLCLAGQSVLHLRFAGRLAGKAPKLRHFAAYFALLCGISLAAAQRDCGELPAIGAGVLALYAMNRLALKNPRPASWLTAVLAFYISQLSFGILNSVESVCFPRFVGTPLLYPLVLAALAAFFALCGGCCRAAARLLDGAADGGTRRLGLLLLPGLFCFSAELYILQTAYRVSASGFPPDRAGRHVTLLCLQAMGLAALLCTLYAYRQLCRGLEARAALRSLTQAARAQQVYIAEAQARYARTRAFRHDIRNHLTVLSGLLAGGRLDESAAYLQKLETAAAGLSFPYQTGSAVVDILLGEKLGLAPEVTAEVSLRLPSPWGIDEPDLCVIFANALDNAVRACRAARGERFLRILGERQGDFCLLTFENSCAAGPLPPAGTGLANIRAAAEKYHGTALAEKRGEVFTLRVLLNAAGPAQL